MKTDLSCTKRSIAIATLCLLCFGLSLGAATVVDDFNDNSKDPAKWSASDEEIGKGKLNETGQRLVYTTSGSPTAKDDAIRRWIAGNGPYTNDWQIQMDVTSTNIATGLNQTTSYGIKLRGTNDDQEVFVEIYTYQGFTGFHAELQTGDTSDQVDSSVLDLSAGAVRMKFDSAQKIVSVWYATTISPAEDQWIELGSFGIGGVGTGGSGNSDWGLSDTDEFRIYVYGYSENTAVTEGHLFGDNFQAAGLTVLTPPSPHDLAITKLTVPKVVNRTEKVPSPLKRVSVSVQNRSDHLETISTMEQFTNLVTLQVQSLQPGDCPDITAVLHSGPPQRALPIVLKPKQQFNVVFDVTFNCAGDVAKGPGHENYKYIATVHHSALGEADTHPECDVCPRSPLGVDPNPDNKIKDKGCGTKQSDGTLGGNVLTDVVTK